MRNTFIDIFFAVYENGHLDRSETKEQKREQTIKKARINIIRINPDKENIDIDNEIGEIQDFINESSIKLGEQSAKNKIIEDSEKVTKLIKQLCV